VYAEGYWIRTVWQGETESWKRDWTEQNKVILEKQFVMRCHQIKSIRCWLDCSQLAATFYLQSHLPLAPPSFSSSKYTLAPSTVPPYLPTKTLWKTPFITQSQLWIHRQVVENNYGMSKRPLYCNSPHVRQHHFPLNCVSELNTNTLVMKRLPSFTLDHSPQDHLLVNTKDYKWSHLKVTPK